VRGGRAIAASSPADDLHLLRKEAKRLRYVLECFGSLFPAGPRRVVVRELKALQECLGDHQDADVHDAQLRDIVRALGPAASPGVGLAAGRLSERLAGQRRAARAQFAGAFGRFAAPTTQRAMTRMLERTSRG